MQSRLWLTGLLLILPALALAEGPRDAGSTAHPFDCESDSRWASRHNLQTPTTRQTCVHPLPGSNQELRVSYLRRGAPAAGLFTDSMHASSAWAPADEMRSRLELAGSWSRLSYETNFDMGREERLDGSRGRSELRFRSGLDLGIVRPGVELRGSVSEDEPEISEQLAGGFATLGDSSLLAGGRATVDVAIPGAPVLTLAVGREQKDVFRGRTLERELVDSDFLSGAIWYQNQRWQAYAASSVYRFRDELQPGARRSAFYNQFVSASYWPTPTLTINPSFSYTNASNDGSQSRMRTLAASLGVYSTALGENGMLTLWSGYTRSYDTARYFDYQQLDLAVGAERAIAELASLGGYGISVGGSVGYSHYLDRLYPDASGPGYRLLLSLKISASGAAANPEPLKR